MAFKEKLIDELENLYRTSLPNKENKNKQVRPYASACMCQRQIMLNMTEETRPVEVSKSLNSYARLGIALEDKTLEDYRKQGSLYLSQWKLEKELFDGLPELNIGGIVDAFIIYNGSIYLYDLKSVGAIDASPTYALSSDDYNRVNNGNNLIITPEQVKAGTSLLVKPSYKSQMQIYAAVTGWDDVFLQFLSRRVQDKFDLKETAPTTKVVRVSTAIDELERRIAVVLYGIACANLNLIPDKLVGIKESHCTASFCSFVDYCWKGENKESLYSPHRRIEEEFTAESISSMKLEAMEKSREYISKRPERFKLSKDMIQSERERRILTGELI